MAAVLFLSFGGNCVQQELSRRYTKLPNTVETISEVSGEEIMSTIYVRKGALVKAVQWDGDNYVEICAAFPKIRFKRHEAKLLLHDIGIPAGEWIIQMDREPPGEPIVTHMPNYMFKDLYQPLNMRDA